MTESHNAVVVQVPKQEEQQLAASVETRPTQASLEHGLTWLTEDGKRCSICAASIEGQQMLDRSLECDACRYVACAVCLGQHDAPAQEALLRAQVDADMCILTQRAVTYNLDEEELYYNLRNYFRNLNTDSVEVQKALVAALKARKQFCSAITTPLVDDKGIDHTQKLRMVIDATQRGFYRCCPDVELQLLLELEEPK